MLRIINLNKITKSFNALSISRSININNSININRLIMPSIINITSVRNISAKTPEAMILKSTPLLYSSIDELKSDVYKNGMKNISENKYDIAINAIRNNDNGTFSYMVDYMKITYNRELSKFDHKYNTDNDKLIEIINTLFESKNINMMEYFNKALYHWYNCDDFKRYVSILDTELYNIIQGIEFRDAITAIHDPKSINLRNIHTSILLSVKYKHWDLYVECMNNINGKIYHIDSEYIIEQLAKADNPDYIELYFKKIYYKDIDAIRTVLEIHNFPLTTWKKLFSIIDMNVLIIQYGKISDKKLMELLLFDLIYYNKQHPLNLNKIHLAISMSSYPELLKSYYEMLKYD